MQIFCVVRAQATGVRAVGELAARQLGRVERSQLRSAGITPGAIRGMVAHGLLHPVLPRVYAVGDPEPRPLALELAAMLHAGHDAVISHHSAAAVWGFVPDFDPEVQVTVIGRSLRPCPGLEFHRVAGLDRRDVRIRYGLPVTAPARALIDLAAEQGDATLARSLAEARVAGLVTGRELEAAMDRAPRRNGVARLRALLADGVGTPAFTRSEAERRFLALVDRAQLPAPRVNTRLHGFEVDALWPAARLVADVDGHAFHGHRAAFERDRRRDQALAAAGYRVIRVTWRQMEREPLGLVARIAQALAAPGG